MDMSMGTSMFQATNMALARAYWYAIAGVVGLFVAVRAVNYYDSCVRLRTCAAASHAHPTQPRSTFLQAWATLTAVGREIAYPQLPLFVRVPYLAWLTPPPAGRIVLLLVYWAVILGFMCAGAIVHDVNFYERIGFRNAWVTVTQLPLLYLLAGKTSVVVTLLTGASHERLNWMHRWIARTMLVTASVHGWHFYTEYARAGLASYFFEVMPMGKYGIAAWALLAWSCVVGLAPLRHLCYEVFVVQHIATAALLLWAVYKHVPAYARYNVWFAIAALALDRAVRLVLLIYQNVNVRLLFSSSSSSSSSSTTTTSQCRGDRRLGHAAQLRAVGDDITVVTIKDVHFKWRAGQHLYLWMPALGPLEHHPYTIACAHRLPETCVCNSIQLVVRKHAGFSKRLHDHATSSSSSGGSKTSWTAFVTGPFGEPARWDIYETLVLISASTGASFTLPILESVLQAAAGGRKTICTKRIDFLLSAKKGDEIGYYVGRLHELIAAAKATDIELSVSIAVTRDPSALVGLSPASSAAVAAPATSRSEKPSSGYSSSSSIDEPAVVTATAATTGESSCCMASARDVEKTAAGLRRVASTDSHVQQLTTRPDIAAFVRRAVEITGGETSVVVCGGKSLVARTRNCVAQLSDERAVHKGTGAQGIHLHVEEYGF